MPLIASNSPTVEWELGPVSNTGILRKLGGDRPRNSPFVTTMDSYSGVLVLCGYMRWDDVYMCVLYNRQLVPTVELFVRQTNRIRPVLRTSVPASLFDGFDAELDTFERAYRMGLL